MDGVLIDAMPFHAEAFQKAFKEIVKIDIDKMINILFSIIQEMLFVRNS
jgi:beta-phosphoglucomutase-like phosphatase (HAD superfamily)